MLINPINLFLNFGKNTARPADAIAIFCKISVKPSIPNPSPIRSIKSPNGLNFSLSAGKSPKTVSIFPNILPNSSLSRKNGSAAKSARSFVLPKNPPKSNRPPFLFVKKSNVPTRSFLRPSKGLNKLVKKDCSLFFCDILKEIDGIDLKRPDILSTIC